MRLVINERFTSRKTAISWPNAGMGRGSDRQWLLALDSALAPHRQVLQEGFEARRKYELQMTIYGKPQQIKLLDVHDALAQVADQITNILFPRPKGKTIPQTQDRHFWRVKATKVEQIEERVEIDLNEL